MNNACRAAFAATASMAPSTTRSGTEFRLYDVPPTVHRLPGFCLDEQAPPLEDDDDEDAECRENVGYDEQRGEEPMSDFSECPEWANACGEGPRVAAKVGRRRVCTRGRGCEECPCDGKGTN